MARANRAQRRSGKAARNIRRNYSRSICPGLPGGVPYVPMSKLEDAAREMEEVVRVMHPGMIAYREQADRLRIAAAGRRDRLRHVRVAAPGGLGSGVVLGEFTAAREERVHIDVASMSDLIKIRGNVNV